MFVVTGYGHSANGRLRYKVRDVNHLTKNRGKKGYITAQWAYVRPVYYQTMHTSVTVINPRGVNAYMNKNWTGRQRTYNQGNVLYVTEIVKPNLTTVSVSPNGIYLTANRQMVTQVTHTHQPHSKIHKQLLLIRHVSLSKPPQTLTYTS